jgi:5-methylcytosine-specific restriction endonuclease McrA
LGGHCLKCGSDKNLQFDHKERKNKDFTIAKLSSINEKKFWKEIQKCQLLCNSCHSEKTLLEVGHISAKDSHGTLSSYRYCKCDLCKKAHSDYCRKWKKRKSLKNA